MCRNLSLKDYGLLKTLVAEANLVHFFVAERGPKDYRAVGVLYSCWIYALQILSLALGSYLSLGLAAVPCRDCFYRILGEQRCSWNYATSPQIQLSCYLKLPEARASSLCAIIAPVVQLLLNSYAQVKAINEVNFDCSSRVQSFFSTIRLPDEMQRSQDLQHHLG